VRPGLRSAQLRYLVARHARSLSMDDGKCTARSVVAVRQARKAALELPRPPGVRLPPIGIQAAPDTGRANTRKPRSSVAFSTWCLAAAKSGKLGLVEASRGAERDSDRQPANRLFVTPLQAEVASVPLVPSETLTLEREH
jgi:hypothetical protein